MLLVGGVSLAEQAHLTPRQFNGLARAIMATSPVAQALLRVREPEWMGVDEFRRKLAHGEI